MIFRSLIVSQSGLKSIKQDTALLQPVLCKLYGGESKTSIVDIYTISPDGIMFKNCCFTGHYPEKLRTPETLVIVKLDAAIQDL